MPTSRHESIGHPDKRVSAGNRINEDVDRKVCTHYIEQHRETFSRRTSSMGKHWLGGSISSCENKITETNGPESARTSSDPRLDTLC